MTRRILNVKLEVLFIKYMYCLLKNGITEGISETEFNEFVDNLKEKINKEENAYFLYTLAIQPDSFENVVNKANHLHSQSKAFILKNVDNNIIAQATYDLYEIELSRCKEMELLRYGNITRLIEEAAKAKSKYKIKYGIEHFEHFPREVINVAKKIAAVYINDSIERYVLSRVDDGNWPEQCRDIDEYIFNRDIAKAIDEPGTRLTFKQLYLHSIDSACEILKSCKNDDVIKFSNYSKEMLAFANLKKLYAPEQFAFLKGFYHNPYKLKNKRINLTIIAESVSFASSYCAFSDPYGEWSDENIYEKGVIDNTPVAIMEKRIGKI